MRERHSVKLRKKNRTIDIAFLLIVLILVAFGAIMVFSASYPNSYAQNGDSFYIIKKHLIFVVAGIAGMLFLSKFPPYSTYEKLSVLIYIIALGMMALVVVINFANGNGGVGRWIYLGFFQFQPSEIMKLAMVIICAALVSKNSGRMKTFRYGVLPFGLVLLPVVGLMMIQHHLSGTIIICVIVLAMMFVGGTHFGWFVAIIPAGAAGLAGIVILKGVGYMQDRVKNWLDPFSDILGDSWQTVQSMIAIGSGGIMGSGLGNSRQKYLYLPEPQNDFIFAIVCEELGFIGAILVIVLFILLVYRGFVIANKAPNKFAGMVVVGITIQIAIQAILNIAVVTNSIPNTGISLPFFSYGGTALMMQLFEMGIILNISRYATEEKVE
ncbi:MAG: putative lipid II flippase FtsW [Massiliimalia sp.]